MALNLELRQLRYFVRVYEEGSVSQAARVLHIAQPALSQQIKQLEEGLGVQLLVRNVRGVTPTAAGVAVYQQALQVLKHAQATLLVAHSGASPAGPVSIGLPWTMTELLGLRLLQAVQQRYPGIQLEITQGPSALLDKLLLQGKLDVAVVFGECSLAEDTGLVMRAIADEPLLLVGAKGRFSPSQLRRGLPIEEVLDWPLLALSRPNGIREAIETVWQQLGSSPKIRAEINAPALLVQAVQAGLGFTLLPSCGIESARRAQAIDATRLRDVQLSRRVYVCHARLHPLSTAAQLTLELVVQALHAAHAEGHWQATLLDAATP